MGMTIAGFALTIINKEVSSVQGFLNLFKNFLHHGSPGLADKP
jgi:hypothetical protein